MRRARPQRERREQDQPRPAITAVRLVETAAQPLEPLLHATAHRARRDPELSRDLRRRESFRVAQEDRRAEWLGELADEPRELLLQLVAGEQLVARRRGDLALRRDHLLAHRPVRLAAPAKPRGIADHAREPRPHRALEIWRPPERRDPGVLDEVVGLRAIADEARRQPAQPGRVLEQGFGRAHVMYMQRAAQRPRKS